MLRPALFSAYLLGMGLPALSHPFDAHAQAGQPADFTETVRNRLKIEKNLSLQEFCPIESERRAEKIFAEYGAYLISVGTQLPNGCFFNSESEHSYFRATVPVTSAKVGGITLTLQRAAMTALLAAEKEALRKGLRITARSGEQAAARSYDETTSLWNTRFHPALAHWIHKGAITQQDAQLIRALPLRDQIAKVLEWEAHGIYFSTYFTKSIFHSVAPPGASQHNVLLAFDASEYADKNIRRILADHGWFQTVVSDAPHFTYLGVKAFELSRAGLKLVSVDGQDYWVPNIAQASTMLAAQQLATGWPAFGQLPTPVPAANSTTGPLGDHEPGVHIDHSECAMLLTQHWPLQWRHVVRHDAARMTGELK